MRYFGTSLIVKYCCTSLFYVTVNLHGHILGKPTVLLEKAAACIASTVKASCMGLSWASSISKLKNMKGNKISLSLGNSSWKAI